MIQQPSTIGLLSVLVQEVFEFLALMVSNWPSFSQPSQLLVIATSLPSQDIQVCACVDASTCRRLVSGPPTFSNFNMSLEGAIQVSNHITLRITHNLQSPLTYYIPPPANIVSFYATVCL